jgi:hypothetical protein
MWTLTRQFLPLSLVAVLGLALGSSAAQAQQKLNGPKLVPYRGQPVNKNWLVSPGVTQRQYNYNLRQQAKAYSYVPPYALGYNPYPQIMNYNPYNPYYLGIDSVPPTVVYNPYAYTSLYANAYNPYNLYGFSYLYR